MGSAYTHHGVVTTLEDSTEVTVGTWREWKPNCDEERTVQVQVEVRNWSCSLSLDLARARALLEQIRSAIEDIEVGRPPPETLKR